MVFYCFNIIFSASSFFFLNIGYFFLSTSSAYWKQLSTIKLPHYFHLNIQYINYYFLLHRNSKFSCQQQVPFASNSAWADDDGCTTSQFEAISVLMIRECLWSHQLLFSVPCSDVWGFTHIRHNPYFDVRYTFSP